MEQAYAIPVEDVLEKLEVDSSVGLNEKEISERIRKYGVNGKLPLGGIKYLWI